MDATTSRPSSPDLVDLILDMLPGPEPNTPAPENPNPLAQQAPEHPSDVSHTLELLNPAHALTILTPFGSLIEPLPHSYLVPATLPPLLLPPLNAWTASEPAPIHTFVSIAARLTNPVPPVPVFTTLLVMWAAPDIQDRPPRSSPGLSPSHSFLRHPLAPSRQRRLHPPPTV
ncbi:hypothetical protein ACEPAI_2197 [Sanghuangporus weigelae]